MIQKGSIRARMLGGLAVVAIVAAACSNSGQRAIHAPRARPRRPVQDRLRQWRRRRQRLARVVDLLGQGPGGLVRQGLQSHRHQPRHGRGRSADRHPRPDRQGRRRDHHQPERSGCAQPGDRRGHRGRHQGRRDRRVRHRRGCLQPVQRPGRVRLPRRQVPVRADGQEGRRRLHARHRRPPGRHRPRHRLQEGPRRISRHHGGQGSRDQVGSGDRGQPDQRHHGQRRRRSTASGPPAWTRPSSMP